jgi:hypothetical protein
MLTPQWGPYTDANDVRGYLSRFVDRACGPDTGIVWAANGTLCPLRAPRRDADGMGCVSIFQWNNPPPPIKRPSGFWERVEAFFNSAMEAEGRAAIEQSKASAAMGQAATQVMSRLFAAHKDDGVGVVFDVVCVALSIALIPTGLGALGVMGLIGGSILLGTDGYAYALELGGDDAGAEDFKKVTEPYRLAATVMTLPDIAYGGAKMIRELAEIRELRAVDRSIARTATNMSARTTNATRAQRFRQIAEKANLRAQIRSEQIAATLKLDATNRISGAGSVGLFVREEIQSNESLLHQFMQYLQVHFVAIHA